MKYLLFVLFQAVLVAFVGPEWEEYLLAEGIKAPCRASH